MDRVIALETPDGCNTCFVCEGAYLGDADCTTVACLPDEVPPSDSFVCVEQPCVDNRGIASYVPDCVASPAGSGEALLACEGDQDAVPAGQDACLDLRYGESLSSECAAAGYVVEFRIRLAADGAYDENSLFQFTCSAPDYFAWANGASTCYGPGPQQVD